MFDEPLFLALGVFELAGLVGLFILTRRAAARRLAGKGRPPRMVRISTALLGMMVIVGFPALMILSIIHPTLWKQRRHDKLVENGTSATAVVNHIEETGTIVNGRPEVRVLVTVEPRDAPAFGSQAKLIFSVRDVQAYQVGVRVNVFYDPADHAEVAVIGLASSGE